LSSLLCPCKMLLGQCDGSLAPEVHSLAIACACARTLVRSYALTPSLHCPCVLRFAFVRIVTLAISGLLVPSITHVYPGLSIAHVVVGCRPTWRHNDMMLSNLRAVAPTWFTSAWIDPSSTPAWNGTVHAPLDPETQAPLTFSRYMVNGHK
jgi:hypothetical protein